MTCDRSVCCMQEYNGGCEACPCNPENREECHIQMEHRVNQILWFDTLGRRDVVTRGFKNEIFEVRPYDQDGETDNAWNFWHKPSDVKVRWYEHPLRSPYCNKEITPEQFLDVLEDCINSLEKSVKIEINPWWDRSTRYAYSVEVDNEDCIEMRCSVCGNLLSWMDTYCSQCGRRLVPMNWNTTE